MMGLPELALALTVSLTLWAGSATTVQAVNIPLMPDPSTILYFTNVTFTIKNRETKEKKSVSFDTATVTSSPNAEGSNITLDFNFGSANGSDISVSDFRMSMFAKKQGGYFSVYKYNITTGDATTGSVPHTFTNIDMISYADITAPLAMSYHCGRFGPIFPRVTLNEEPRNFTPSVEFLDFQFQTFLKNNTRFGRSYDCVGFFSIGILSGAFVTILLLGILTWGLIMIMNLNTMDRFDDPKGKQIAVSATD